MTNILGTIFHIDALGAMMISLVSFLGLVVTFFSFRYMSGDSRYRIFITSLLALIVSVIFMIAADNLAIILIGWIISNAILVRLMIHQPAWKAARASGWLAFKTFLFGATCLAAAFGLLYYLQGLSTVTAIIHAPPSNDPLFVLSLSLILITAMTQSAIWPFHRWLISSLNSPTPVSAVMHAGLVNGGGFLIVKFSPLYLSQPKVLLLIFTAGLATALIGTFWKLMQHDVKRMLACSTMGQMGFMLLQIGLGLFPAAIAHIFWHGMFKAYLFLGFNSVGLEKRIYKPTRTGLATLLLALLCGFEGSYFFALTSGKSFLAGDSTIVLLGVAFVTATQFSFTLIRSPLWRHLPVAILLTGLGGSLYGASVSLVTNLLGSSVINHTQPLKSIHLIGIGLLLIGWLIIVFYRSVEQKKLIKHLSPLYVKALNASQPHPATITAHRNQYQYRGV